MKIGQLSPAYALSLAALATAAVAAQSQAEKLSKIATMTPEQREILRHMSIVYLDDGQGGQAKTVRIDGVNVQIVNGLGATNGYPADPTATASHLVRTNGLGNLIVGYNELGNPVSDDRSGSHNLIVGTSNSYGSFGGAVMGFRNRATSVWASVTGGRENQASGQFAAVAAGENNYALGYSSAVLGGSQNRASGPWSVIAGGVLNQATTNQGYVGGGQSNTASGVCASVSGGKDRVATGSHDWVAGSLFEDN